MTQTLQVQKNLLTKPRGLGLQRLRREGALAPALAFVAFFAIYLAVNPGLLTRFQLQSAANLVVPLAIVALAQLFVVLTSGIDISIGAMTSLCNVVFATQYAQLSPPVAILLALVTGALCGLFNGVLVAYLKLPAIAVTLASSFIFAALARQILDRPGGTLGEAVYFATSGELFPFFPVALLWLGVAAVLAWLILQRTSLGRQIYGIGSNRHAVQAAGLNSRLTILAAFTIAGVLVAYASILLAGSTMTGDPRSGDPYLLTSIAAVALSGAAFSGGKGSVLGTVLAAVTLGMVGNLLFFAGINSYWQYVINALIILAVVVVPVIMHRSVAALRGARK
jgi:ribose transport system permease protein